MRKERIVIATIGSWNIRNAEAFEKRYKNKFDVFIFKKKEALSYGSLKRIKPRFVFFPHWSWMIPGEIYKNFDCIVFHMTDLPLGRGGSPLQNLIARGIYKTRISAIKVSDGIDAGPVYIKRKLDLKGNALEIFKRASEIIFNDMAPYIIKNDPRPVPQKGKIVKFRRRNPSESDISGLNSLEKIYDHIRMLDAENYPPAFIETKSLRVEFYNAGISKRNVTANVRIIKR